MDLKSEILRVLDDPSRVWEAVLANLAPEPRISILVFTTCETPISIVHWQEALARVSPTAAVVFEASLRTLDDSFVSIHRPERPKRGETSWLAEFRNPSMDDFCSDYLDRNVGTLLDIANKAPAVSQVERIVDLGIAYAPVAQKSVAVRPRRYPNIYESLIADPAILVNRLLTLMPEDKQPFEDTRKLVLAILSLMANSRNLRDEDVQRVRSHIYPLLASIRFGSYNSFIYQLLDVRPNAIQVSRIFGPNLEEFYKNLADSAFELNHFDTLVNFDCNLDRSPHEAFWASQFLECTDEWLEDEMSSEEIDSARDTYSKVISYLDLEYDRQSEWDEKYDNALEEEAREASEEEDDSALEDSGDSFSRTGLRESYAIDQMFSGLRDPIR